jgi:hypothetical protein
MTKTTPLTTGQNTCKKCSSNVVDNSIFCKEHLEEHFLDAEWDSKIKWEKCFSCGKDIQGADLCVECEEDGETGLEHDCEHELEEHIVMFKQFYCPKCKYEAFIRAEKSLQSDKVRTDEVLCDTCGYVEGIIYRLEKQNEIMKDALQQIANGSVHELDNGITLTYTTTNSEAEIIAKEALDKLSPTQKNDE